MSYCRWSSDNFRCDLYVYDSVEGGYAIHVASNRTVDDPPEIPDFGTVPNDEFVLKHKAQMDWLMSAERRLIGLSRDGRSYYADDLEELLAIITSLRDEGYRVPQYVFDTIREEIDEEKAA